MALIKSRIVLRNDSLQNWEAHSDVVLLKGEVAIAFLESGEEKIKIGNGVSTWAELDWFGGSVKISADGKSVSVTEAGVVSLYGFDAAEVGAYPVKTEEGTLKWVLPITEDYEGLKTEIETLKSEVTVIKEIVTPTAEGALPLTDRIDNLEAKLAGTEDKTVVQLIDEKINDFANKVTDDGTVNTIKELVDYVAEHGSDAAEMTADISALKALVGTVPVEEQIEEKLENYDAALSKKLEKAYEQVRYEVSHKPEGAQVSYRDHEIRVMCAKDTEWKLQNSGENADPTAYYIGFKAYAPEGAVSFKEDLAEIIADQTMYRFEGNDFAGVDEFGRKYSIVWLPAAKYDEASDTWNYYGAMSSKQRYIGWYYTVEWYDEAGGMIETDTVRINLANEECFNHVEPFYMGNMIKEIAVNGTLLDVINRRVDIYTANMIKNSDEITVNDDGSLGIVGIPVSKLVEDDETVLILNGGGAPQ